MLFFLGLDSNSYSQLSGYDYVLLIANEIYILAICLGCIWIGKLDFRRKFKWRISSDFIKVEFKSTRFTSNEKSHNERVIGSKFLVLWSHPHHLLWWISNIFFTETTLGIWLRMFILLIIKLLLGPWSALNMNLLCYFRTLNKHFVQFMSLTNCSYEYFKKVLAAWATAWSALVTVSTSILCICKVYSYGKSFMRACPSLVHSFSFSSADMWVR